MQNTNVLFYIGAIGITLTDIASLATSIGLIVAVFQLALDRSVRKENAKRNSIKEAVNIAKLFQTKLIDSICFVESVFRETGLTEYVNAKIPKNKPLRFTKEEALELTLEECNSIIMTYTKKETLEVLAKAAFLCPQFVFGTAKQVSEDTRDMDEKIIYRNKHLQYVDKRTEILNTLEWAAMLFCTGVANDTVIYQSLHKIFIDIVHENYFFIACNNTDENPCDQIFCNVITLYNSWIQKSNKMKIRDSRRSRKQQKRLTRLKCKEARERSKGIVKVPHM